MVEISLSLIKIRVALDPFIQACWFAKALEEFYCLESKKMYINLGYSGSCYTEKIGKVKFYRENLRVLYIDLPSPLPVKESTAYHISPYRFSINE